MQGGGLKPDPQGFLPVRSWALQLARGPSAPGLCPYQISCDPGAGEGAEPHPNRAAQLGGFEPGRWSRPRPARARKS